MLVNEYEKYDRAICEFLKMTLPEKVDPIPLFFASSHRAFHSIKYLFNADKNRIPLPAIAVLRSDSIPAADRFVFNVNTRISYPPNQTNPNTIKTAPFYPEPVDIVYTVDMIALKEPTMNFMRKALKMKFIKDVSYVWVDLEEYGRKYLGMRFEGSNDSSELESGESDIKIRETGTISFRGWLFHDVVELKTVKNVDVGICDVNKSPEELLDALRYSFAL